jgi:biotin transporter BioY
MGILFGAPVAGFLKSKNYNFFLCCFACYFFVHLFGCMYLMKFVAADEILKLGLYPFIIPEMWKIFIVYTITKMTK